MKCPELEQLPPPPPGKTGWPWTVESPRLPVAMAEGYCWPRISIVTPSYNQGRFLEETIRSVLLQGYPDLEYIIMDGKSEDRSIDILEKYSPWIHYWESKPDRGQAHAINKGFAMASGSVFGWLNSDDLLAPGALARLMALKERNPESVAWVGACKDIGADGNFLRTRLPRPGNARQFANWSHEAWIPQPSCLFDAGAFREAGSLDERLHYVLDVDLWVRLAKKGAFASTRQVVSLERMYAGIKSREDIPMQQAEHILVCFKEQMPEVARIRMNHCMISAMDAWPYRHLLRYFIQRSVAWAWRCFRRLCGR